MADLFAEADDALRKERALNFWKQYKFYIIAFITGTVVMTGVLSAYRTWDESIRAAQTQELIALQSAKDFPENILKAEKLDLRPGVRAIALLDAASAFVEKKKSAEALTLYKRAAEDASLPEEYSQLAILMSMRLAAEDKKATAEDLLKMLEPVRGDPGSLWRAHALLESAVIAANRQNDLAKAREYLNTLQDASGLPQSLYQKAQALDHVYAVRQSKQKPKDDEKS